MSNGMFVSCLNIEITKDSYLTTEDKVLYNLFKEKGLTKEEIHKILFGISYREMKSVLDNMQNKGFIVFRENECYYLTSQGVYELQYRLNTNEFFRIFDSLISKKYDRFQVTSFMKNRFYRFYIQDEWNDDLENQYIEWCESNSLEPQRSKSKVRKM